MENFSAVEFFADMERLAAEEQLAIKEGFSASFNMPFVKDATDDWKLDQESNYSAIKCAQRVSFKGPGGNFAQVDHGKKSIKFIDWVEPMEIANWLFLTSDKLYDPIPPPQVATPNQ